MEKYLNKLSEKNILILIISVSVVLRLLAAFYLGNQVQELPGIADQITYHTLATRVNDGFGFSFDQPWWPATKAGEPTAHWSYLYTFFLSLVYKIFGSQPLIVRVIQVIIVGTLQPLLLYLITKMLFGERPAVFASLWIAAYPYIVYYSAALLTESFFITTLLAVFWKTLEIHKGRDGWQDYLVLGLLIGPLILLRQVVLVFVPFIFLWLFWVKRKKKFTENIFRLVVAGAISLAFILPFTIYNYARFQTFVLLNTNAGFAFYWSNHPIYETKFVGILPEEMGNYLDLLPKELINLNEAELDSALLKRGLTFVIDDPGRYFLLSISRIPVLFEFWPTPGSSTLSNLTRVSSFGIALPFMIWGILLSLKRLRQCKENFLSSPLFLMLGFGVIYAGIHLLSWSLVRYRVPIDALFLSFAGLAVSNLYNTLFRVKSKTFVRGTP